MTAGDLLSEIDAFLARDDVQMTDASFGKRVVNDGKFVGRLRDGSSTTLKTAEKVRAFMTAYTKPSPQPAPVQVPA